MEKERQTLERRLVESREQLTEIKTSWSSKIEALESQISHLNLKQVGAVNVSQSVSHLTFLLRSMQLFP